MSPVASGTPLQVLETFEKNILTQMRMKKTKLTQKKQTIKYDLNPNVLQKLVC